MEEKSFITHSNQHRPTFANVKIDNTNWLCIEKPNRLTLFESETERFIYNIISDRKEPGNYFSEKLLDTYKLDYIEIDIVDSLYKEQICKMIKELYILVDLTENILCMNILWILLNHDYGTRDDFNLKIRESWLSSPNSYYFVIGGEVDSIDSGKGEWVVWYNEYDYPYDKKDLKEYHYKTDQMFSMDTVVNVSYEVFKRMRLITRFLNYGPKAIEVIQKQTWLTKENHCGILIMNDKDDLDI